MSDFLPQDHPVLRSMVVDAVFQYYDSPVLFVARNDLGFPFLALAVDEVEGRTYYLYVPMSESRLMAVRTGLVALRDAFRHPERQVLFLVELSLHGPPVVHEVAAASLRNEWLPDAGEFLQDQLDTAPHFLVEEFRRTAVREGRHLLALEVDTAQGVLRTELPLRATGPLLTEFQELADSIAPDSEFTLVQLQAASFVLILTPLVGGRLFNTPSSALHVIIAMFNAAATDEFGIFLSDLSPRRKTHVRDFFSVLSDASTGVTLFSASPEGALTETVLPLERVRGGLQILRTSRDLDSETVQFAGSLIALNHYRRTFSVRESVPTSLRKRPRAFTGKFDPTVNIEGVASGQTVLYRFTILRERQSPEFDDSEIKYTNRMLAMKLLDEQGAI